MNERQPVRERIPYEAVPDAEGTAIEKGIANTVIALGKLAADFSKITRIPRHIDGRHENDAEHSYMLMLVASAVAEKYYPGLDLTKVERFSLVHDLAEVRTGDINTFDVTPEELKEKERREREATLELQETLPPALADALTEYEHQEVSEAIFVRTIDKLLPMAMDIVGDGLTVVREDFGIATIDKLIESHNGVRERLSAKFGQDFPHIIGAHAILCAAFERDMREKLVEATETETPDRLYEIERKYLVDPDFVMRQLNLEEFTSSYLRQGYIALGSDGAETRVRSFNDEKFELTVKTPGMVERGEKTIRLESREMFDGLWEQTKGRRVEKRRYYIPSDKYTIELDVYEGHLAGLMTAEVEFDGRIDDARLKAATFTPPGWFGSDISEDPRYKNRNLAQTRPRDITAIGANL